MRDLDCAGSSTRLLWRAICRLIYRALLPGAKDYAVLLHYEDATHEVRVIKVNADDEEVALLLAASAEMFDDAYGTHEQRQARKGTMQ